jgi:hypothetical protein
MEGGKIAILKELLNGGAFESANFIRKLFLNDYIPHFLDEPRNEFLLNVLCFERTLLPGREPHEDDFHFTEEEGEDDMLKEMLFGRALAHVVKNNTDLNRLRLFWSFQRLYLNDEDHIDYILEELNYVTFKVAPENQAEVTREFKFILNSAYSAGPF